MTNELTNELPPSERRRSERILQELLIKVSWRNSKGKEIRVSTRTVNVSRYGAKILMKDELIPGQEIGVHCLITAKEGKARVVGLAEKQARVYFYGIEFLDQDNNLWNIPFRLLLETLE